MKPQKVIIIAEAGVNHNGKIELAKQLIDAAAISGADYVKFQTWITEDLVDKNSPKALYQRKNDKSKTQFEMLKKLELSFDEFRLLKKYAENKKIKFLSTPDDFNSLNFLADELDLPMLKIGSAEIGNYSFLRAVAMKNTDVILSTGMATMNEVQESYDTLIKYGAKSVSLLHCTSNYPATFESVNLKAMQTLQNVFNTKIGYSDHTQGIETSIAAVALGAKIIEKHFTLDKKMEGPDHSASIDSIELRKLVDCIRNVEKAISGDGIKKPHSSELDTKKVVLKGLYLTMNLDAGTVITEEMLTLKRPNLGIEAGMYYEVIGKRVKINLKKHMPLKKEYLNFE